MPTWPDDPLPVPEKEDPREDVALTIRISKELRDVLHEVAKAEHRSLNTLLTVFAELQLAAIGKWPPGAAPKPPRKPWERKK
jgi:hypothetical protein